MRLHRSMGRPDWEGIDRASMNIFQRMAVATGGIATPANAASVAGLMVVGTGLWALIQHSYLLAAALIATGRLFDIADGWLAEATQTKSPLGELLDAVIDKLVVLFGAIALFAADVAPWGLLVILLAPQTWAAFVSMIYTFRGQKLHPSPAGKSSMAVLWFCLLGLIVNAAAGELAWLAFVLYVAAAISVLLGTLAAVGYTRGQK